MAKAHTAHIYIYAFITVHCCGPITYWSGLRCRWAWLRCSRCRWVWLRCRAFLLSFWCFSFFGFFFCFFALSSTFFTFSSFFFCNSSSLSFFFAALSLFLFSFSWISISFFFFFSSSNCRHSSFVRSRAWVEGHFSTIDVLNAGHTRRSDNVDLEGPGLQWFHWFFTRNNTTTRDQLLTRNYDITARGWRLTRNHAARGWLLKRNCEISIRVSWVIV